MSDTVAAGWPRRTAWAWGGRLLLVVATALVLTMLAPWRTGHVPGLRRAAEFLVAALAWEGAIAVAAGQVRRRLGAARLATPCGLALTVLAASVPATAIVATVLLLAGDWPGPLAAYYAQSLLLGLGVAFARRGLGRRSAGVEEPAVIAEVREALVPDLAARFLQQHAPALAGRLLALQAEDHYLRIHTEAGSALVLLRMRDAVAELGPEAGWQPHRSFWLARGVEGRASRRGQAWQVTLVTGLVVPVSKPAVSAMREAGYTGTG